LYYYGENKNYRAKYENIDDVTDAYLNDIEQNNILNNICIGRSRRLNLESKAFRGINENDEVKFINNTFFKIFCHNEYKNDTLNTNIVAHYEQQLIDNGFVLTTEGENKKLNSEVKDAIDERISEINEKLFEDYVNNPKDRHKNMYDKINERVKLLNLPKNNKKVLIEYKDQITNPHKLADHYNTIRLFKSNEYIESKINEAIKNNFICKIMNNVYNKIKLIKSIETKYNIVDFCIMGDYSESTTRLDTKSVGENNQLTDDEYKVIKKIFRISRNKPENDMELILMYVTMIPTSKMSC
jgi:hypothetical protein